MSQCQCSANPCGWSGHGAGEQCDVEVTIETVCVDCGGHSHLGFAEGVQNVGRGRDQ
ncbi:MAG TPA: hypothetical protein VGF98_00440 [Candidatus Tumulicola sp.]